jgi:predicted nucleic acid-binding protein
VIFIDTNVFVYAMTDSAYAEGSRLVVGAAGNEPTTWATSAAVIEELWHLESTGRLPGADGAARDAFELLRPVLDVSDAIIETAFGLTGWGLGTNDRVHVATCRVHDISTIVTADRAFEAVPGLRRVDPSDLNAIGDVLRTP